MIFFTIRVTNVHSTCLMRSLYHSSFYHLFISIFKKWSALLDTKFDVLKMNAYLKNAFGCIPFLAMEAKSRNQKDVWNCRPYFSSTPFFAKQLTIFQPRGLGHQIWCFENESTFKKCCWLHSFLAMEAKSRNQKGIWNWWPGFIPVPNFFAKQLTISQPRGLRHQIWCFENESTFKKCCWLHSFLAMETKSRNQKGIWNCWPCFCPAPNFLPNS